MRELRECDGERVRMCVSGEIPIPGIGKPRVKYTCMHT